VADSPDVPTISVIGLKGGAGKTTVTLGLAGAAQARRLATLVVDLDPQANATAALDPGDVQLTANDVLADPRKPTMRDAVAATSWGDYCSVVPSEPDLIHRDYVPDGKAGEHRLRSALATIAGSHALTIIDCPPSLGQLTANALTASDATVVVSEPSLFSLTGTQQTITAVDAIRKRFNLRLRTAGIIVNRYNSRSTEHRFRLNELIKAYRDLVLEPVIPERAVISRAQGSCHPLQSWPSATASEVSTMFEAHLHHLQRCLGTPARALTGTRS
jgi:chromosome partitioning protein